MSELNFLEKLLGGVEVEWLPLKNVAEVRSGWGFPNAYQGNSEGDYPFYKVSDMNTIGNETVMSTANNFISNEIVNKLGIRLAPARTIIFPKIGAAIATNKKRILSMPSAYDNNVMGLVTNEKVIPRYVFYWIQTINLSTLAHDSGAVPSIRKGEVEALLFPIPCPDNAEKSLAIQSEIVRILDKFTTLTAELNAELNAELTMRKKQYNYYRDQLLSFDDGDVEWKTLGDIGHFTYGYAAKAQDVGDARFVRITDINTNGKLSQQNPMFVDINKENEKYILDKDDLLMARTGATYGKTMIYNESYPAIYAGFLIKLSLNKKIINPKYYWHFAQSHFFWEQANKLVSGGGQPQFNANALKQVKLPVPYPTDAQKSLEEQARIVEILDKFDSIVSSVTEDLPREIELRQKQYEYYRDMLFSFPKPEVAEA